MVSPFISYEANSAWWKRSFPCDGGRSVTHPCLLKCLRSQCRTFQTSNMICTPSGADGLNGCVFVFHAVHFIGPSPTLCHRREGVLQGRLGAAQRDPPVSEGKSDGNSDFEVSERSRCNVYTLSSATAAAGKCCNYSRPRGQCLDSVDLCKIASKFICPAHVMRRGPNDTEAMSSYFRV